MPEIHKMLEGLDKAYWVKPSMLLLRKILKFPKLKKLPSNHFLNRFFKNLSENVAKVPKIPICSGQMLMEKYMLEFQKC